MIDVLTQKVRRSIFSLIYIMLDALDECASKTLEDTIGFICRIKDLGIKIFCTFRPILINLGERLSVQTIHSIDAHEEDIRNYLSLRLNNEWLHDKCVLEQIIDRLAEGAKRKLVSSSHNLLNIDFCLRNFN
jgi:hypothetical protein